MSANYKNWVPNGMITALSAGTAILGVGTAALMCAKMNPKLKKAVAGTVGAGTLVTGAMTAWSVYAHGKFSYDGNRRLSKEIVEGTAKYVTLIPVIFINWGIMTVVLKATEEKWLRELYGQAYEDYCKRVNRCIPCKRK